MDQAERERILEYIRSKNVKPVKVTPERQAEIQKLLSEVASQLKLTQTGPDDYEFTTRDVESDLRGGRSGQDEGVIFAGALTKAVVMVLPKDSFILSNCYNNDGTPILVRVVGEQARRAELWNQVRALRMNGRRFYVFAHESGLNAHLDRLEKIRARYDEQHRR